MERMGIYLRISDDRDGNQTATQRQDEDCRRFAESKRWVVADVFEDVDLSAYKRRVKRPEFERLLSAVRNREIDGVLAWKIDRITRRQRDFVRLDEECEGARAFIATVVEGIDTRTPTGRFVAELLVSQARMESENSSIRIKRSHEERAKMGQITRGGFRPFGYTMDREIIADEAELIQEAAARALAGEGVRGICFDWERRQIRTPAGNLWRQENLRRVLIGAVISGQRDYGGTLVPGQWDAIISSETSTKLRLALARRPRPPGPRAPHKLLLGGGFALCGRCGGALVSRPDQAGHRRYVCARHPGLPNCGRLARPAEFVDGVVSEALFIALDDSDVAAYMRQKEHVGDDGGLLGNIRSDEESLEQLSRDYYVDGAIGRVEFFAARDAIQARLEANRARLGRKTGQEMLHQVVGAGMEVARRWPTASLEWKRAVLMAVIDHVVIMPGLQGSHKLNRDAIQIIWKF